MILRDPLREVVKVSLAQSKPGTKRKAEKFDEDMEREFVGMVASAAQLHSIVSSASAPSLHRDDGSSVGSGSLSRPSGEVQSDSSSLLHQGARTEGGIRIAMCILVRGEVVPRSLSLWQSVHLEP